MYNCTTLYESILSFKMMFLHLPQNPNTFLVTSKPTPEHLCGCNDSRCCYDFRWLESWFRSLERWFSWFRWLEAFRWLRRLRWLECFRYFLPKIFWWKCTGSCGWKVGRIHCFHLHLEENRGGHFWWSCFFVGVGRFFLEKRGLFKVIYGMKYYPCIFSGLFQKPLWGSLY